MSSCKSTSVIIVAASLFFVAIHIEARVRNNSNSNSTSNSNSNNNNTTKQVTITITITITKTITTTKTITITNNNNNQQQQNTIWRGTVSTGEEHPPHSGELNHALSPVGGPTQSQLSRLMSSGHHISMEHRQRRKQLNSDGNASKETYLKEMHQSRKRRRSKQMKK